MTTTFCLLRQVCGLSHREAAEFLKVPEHTIIAWDTRRGVPFDAVHQLRILHRSLEKAAEEEVRRIRKRAPAIPVLELGLASDDVEARQLGLPCVGAHQALLGLIAAKLNRHVRVVPAGSTVATAAAMDAFERGR